VDAARTLDILGGLDLALNAFPSEDGGHNHKSPGEERGERSEAR